MRKQLVALVATAILSVSQVHAGEFAPAPKIIAEYDRSFIERSGAQTFGEMLDTGIIRYFFTGGRNWLVLVNGRPYATTNENLDNLPLSMIERIEVLRAESLGTFGGHAAIRGALNLVLRKDLDGFDVRTVARLPSRDGGDALQASTVWGGKIGTDGHLTVGVDILNRKEIVGSTREHSRSEWASGGNFAEAKNVSYGGNTVYIYDTSENKLRSVPLGSCDTALGYTGSLTNPPGITSGDNGCGFAFGNIWWDSPSYEQENAILNLNQRLGEHAELHVDANVTKGRGAFRYAPSVGTFSFSVTSNPALRNAINQEASKYEPARRFTVENNDIFSAAHRFIGHGNRDWRSNYEGYNVSASVQGRLTEALGYDAQISAFESDFSLSGETFVDTEAIRQEIAAGTYDLTDPLSTNNQAAIEASSLSEADESSEKYLGSRFALEGAGPGFGGRKTSWTVGLEFTKVEDHRQLTFLASDGTTRDVSQVLGSGGTSYAGERTTIGAFSEVSLPLTDSMDVRAAARADKLSDIGGLRAWRLGTEYHLSDIVTLRGSWSSSDGTPSMDSLYRTNSLDYPYVLCVPTSGPPPRTCDTINIRQVKRITSGNPEIKPPESERGSIGIEIRKEPFYFLTDWYRLTASNLPGQYTGTYAMLYYEECSPPYVTSSCIERMAGDITIHDRLEGFVDSEISGVNTRFGTRVETGWGFVATRGLWRYVSSSDLFSLPRNAVRIETSTGRGNVTAFWALNYRDEIEQFPGRFDSWIGHDLTLDWKEPLGFENTRLTAGVYNVTDAKLSTHTADPSSTDGPLAAVWGRTFFVTLNMRF